MVLGSTKVRTPVVRFLLHFSKAARTAPSSAVAGGSTEKANAISNPPTCSAKILICWWQ